MRRASPGSPAPSARESRLEVLALSANAGRNPKEANWLAICEAASSVGPRREMMPRNTVKAPTSARSVAPAGSEMRPTDFSSLTVGRTNHIRPYSSRYSRSSSQKASSPWMATAIRLPQAAPATPQPKPNTKRAASAAFTTTTIHDSSIGVRVLPRPSMIARLATPTSTKGISKMRMWA